MYKAIDGTIGNYMVLENNDNPENRLFDNDKFYDYYHVITETKIFNKYT
jgi:hypothetical protein